MSARQFTQNRRPNRPPTFPKTNKPGGCGNVRPAQSTLRGFRSFHQFANDPAPPASHVVRGSPNPAPAASATQYCIIRSLPVKPLAQDFFLHRPPVNCGLVRQCAGRSQANCVAVLGATIGGMEPNPYEAPREASNSQPSTHRRPNSGVTRTHVTLVLGCFGIGAWPGAHIILTPHEVPLALKLTAALVSLVSLVAIIEGTWKLTRDELGESP